MVIAPSETAAPASTEARQAGLSLVLPCYNEGATLAETVERSRQALREWGGPHEIIVVDDGSTDQAPAGLAEDEGLRLLRHERNRGYGAALKTGFAAARHDWVGFLDADASYPPEQLGRLLEAMPEADMAVGRREGYAAHSSLGRNLAQRAILLPLARYLTGRAIPDINSGMRVLRRRLLERYWAILPDGFSLTTTLTLAFLSAGLRVAYVPVEFQARRGHSKIRPARDLTNFVLLILRTVTYFHPLKVYLPLSLGLVAASIVLALVTKYVFGRLMDMSALFLFIAGLQMLLIGVVADLVFKLLGRNR